MFNEYGNRRQLEAIKCLYCCFTIFTRLFLLLFVLQSARITATSIEDLSFDLKPGSRWWLNWIWPKSVIFVSHMMHDTNCLFFHQEKMLFSFQAIPLYQLKLSTSISDSITTTSTIRITLIMKRNGTLRPSAVWPEGHVHGCRKTRCIDAHTSIDFTQN